MTDDVTEVKSQENIHKKDVMKTKASVNRYEETTEAIRPSHRNTNWMLTLVVDDLNSSFS